DCRRRTCLSRHYGISLHPKHMGSALVWSITAFGNHAHNYSLDHCHNPGSANCFFELFPKRAEAKKKMSARAEFDCYAEQYDEALEQGISISGESKDYFARGRISWLAEQLSQRDAKTRSVLDYGCGTGTATNYLLELLKVDRVTGTDISPESIRVAAT